MEENLKFEEFNLSKNVQRALTDIGYEYATPIQVKAIPQLIEGKDFIGQSQTGTGKTACYSLPIIEKIDKANPHVQAIVLCPTRELAVQITEEIKKFTKYEKDVNCLAVYGGEPIERQIRELKRGVKIVIGTPGRIMDHMRRKTLKLETISMVVLDEADEMLNMGFEEDINTILSSVPEKRQTILFSATMNERILKIAKKYLKEPITIKVKAKELTVDKIEQISLEVKSTMKDEIVMRLIELDNPKKAVIFCNTKRKVDNLIEVLKKKGFKAESLHGDIKQEQRQRIMNRLKKGEFQILVATDVVARGIDIDELELVINYDIPQEEEYYVHRIGRTGRNGNSGKAYTFVVGKEKNKIRGIEKYANTKILSGKLPTIEQIQKVKNNKLVNEIQSIIDSHTYEENETNKRILGQLLQNNDATSIAQALLEMLNQNATIAEDLPKVTNGEIVKLFINVGKKDNVMNKDIVGSIASNSAVSGSDLGKISVLENFSFVEVPQEYVEEILNSMQGKKIKGRECHIEVAKR